MPEIARNAPCPCGSGKKYKLCHLPLDEAARPFRASESQQLDHRMVPRLLRFAEARLGEAFAPAADCPVPYEDETIQLLLPWTVYCYPVGERTVAEHYLADRQQDLDPRTRVFLEAQVRTPISVWEVEAVEPGEWLELRDELTGERRRVVERAGSKVLVPRSVLLGRVVDLPGVAILVGVHPAPLRPEEGARVLEVTEARLGRPPGPADLGTPELTGTLMKVWEEVEEARHHAPPPVLTNTDGEVLELHEDTFEIAKGQRREVLARLLEMKGAQESVTGRGVTFLRMGNPMHPEWENTVIGSARVGNRWLTLETNSRPRANALARRVKKACRGLLRFEKRRVKDLEAYLERARAQDPGPALPDPAEDEGLAQALLEMKRRHYETWPDTPIPALDGLTPRQAAREPAMRRRLDVLLKELEHSEARGPAATRYDMAVLRRALGLAG